MAHTPDRIGLVLAVAAMTVAGSALARDGTRDLRDGEARDAGTALKSEDGSLPAGHPPTNGSDTHARERGSEGGLFEAPEDLEQPDPLLPVGTIVVDLLNGDGLPVVNEVVTLGMLINSIAKGDSRKRVQGTTDNRGRVVFGGLETASNVAYRVSSSFQGGAFAASPFQLEHAKAMHVVLHVYPVAHDLQHALIVAEVVVAAEVREDRLQVEEVLKVYNLGRTAWQPENVRMMLPEGFTAFNAQASMTDQGIDEVDRAATLRGTFPPGQHAVEFRWQLPLSGDKDFDFDVGLPPHVAVARVMMPAAAELKLMAKELPPAEIRQDTRGQKFLVTERRLRPGDPTLTALTIGIHGLPTPGPGRLVATLFAALGVAAGLVLSFSRRPHSVVTDSSATRSRLLDDFAELERARISGDVGAKTYERAHRELVDALARTLAGLV